MPQVAIYHAPDINAFATGARRDASLVAVSTGLLQNMSRDEAGVIAHEISHGERRYGDHDADSGHCEHLRYFYLPHHCADCCRFPERKP